MHTNVLRAATDRQDKLLLAKLAVGDLVSIGAEYHLRCLAALYNKHVAFTRYIINAGEVSPEMLHGYAFSNVAAYIDQIRETCSTPVFKLAEVTKVYNNCLDEISNENLPYAHATRLKDQLLALYPDLTCQKSGRDVIFMIENNVADYMQQSYDHVQHYTNAMMQLLSKQQHWLEKMF